MNPEIIVASSAQEMALQAALKCEASCREAIARRAQWSIALTGGSSPAELYKLFATPEWQSRIDWARTQVFWGDDRAVAPDDDKSNFKQGQELLLRHLNPQPKQIHRMRGEAQDLDEAARDYETQLQALNAPLDCVLLGMGPDGHCASIFPQSPVLQEDQRLCVATPVATQEPHVRRLTLTLPALNSAGLVLVQVAGAAKSARVQQVLHGARDVQNLPIQGVQPKGDLIWILDEAAHQAPTTA